MRTRISNSVLKGSARAASIMFFFFACHLAEFSFGPSAADGLALTPPSEPASHSFAVEEQAGRSGEASALPVTAALQSRTAAEVRYPAFGLDPAAQSAVNRQEQRLGNLRLDLRGQPVKAQEKPTTQLPPGGEYAGIDFSYRSIGRPDSTIRWDGAGGEGGAGKNPARLALDGSALYNSLTDPENVPGMFTTSLGANLSLTYPLWPSLTIGMARTSQESAGEAGAGVSGSGLSRMGFVESSFSGQLSYGWRFVEIGVGTMLSQTLDTAWGIQETDRRAYMADLSFNLMGGRLLLSPGLSWTEEHSGGQPGSSILLRTEAASLSATGTLIPDELTFNGEVSLSRSTAPLSPSLGGGTVTEAASGMLTWRFDKYLGSHGQQALSLRVTWSRINDPAISGQSTNDLGVLLSLDVSRVFLFQ